MPRIQILQSNPKVSLANLPIKNLLIDTNFFIDAAKYTSPFSELLEELKANEFILVSIEATLIEFAKGSKSIEDYSKKIAFYKDIIHTTLPLEPVIHENVSNITRALLKKGGQLSYVDCLLLGTTMKYKESLYFLTKDRSDIPVSIFNVVATIIIETQDNNCTFSIYEFNEKAFEELLTQLLKTTQK